MLYPCNLSDKHLIELLVIGKATEQFCTSRITVAWPDVPSLVASNTLPELPFEPIDFDQDSIDQIVGSCEIDHSVGPIPHTVGGGELDTAAGMISWRENSPITQMTGTTCCWMRPAECPPTCTAAWCRRSGLLAKPRPLVAVGPTSSLTNCSSGARWHMRSASIGRITNLWTPFHHGGQTLQQAETDPRAASLSGKYWLADKRAIKRTDAAQQSLLIHGELHNNLRMTWGKAFLKWTANAADALAKMIDLNHRYALDGNDPASYGGLLWCLGQFDRPSDYATPADIRHPPLPGDGYMVAPGC